MKNKTKNFALRMPEGLFNSVYEKALKDNKSINKTINILINSAMLENRNYFELQYLDTGQKFGFKDEHENKEIKTPTVYRLNGLNRKNGAFICQDLTNKKNCELKFSTYFYKPIFVL